jgi:hypothetical protein
MRPGVAPALFAGDAAFKADTYFDLVLVNLLWYVSAAAGASSLISIVARWASLRGSAELALGTSQDNTV